jgi:hypothetical protein
VIVMTVAAVVVARFVVPAAVVVTRFVVPAPVVVTRFEMPAAMVVTRLVVPAVVVVPRVSGSGTRGGRGAGVDGEEQRDAEGGGRDEARAGDSEGRTWHRSSLRMLIRTPGGTAGGGRGFDAATVLPRSPRDTSNACRVDTPAEPRGSNRRTRPRALSRQRPLPPAAGTPPMKEDP